MEDPAPERPMVKPWWRVAWADGRCLLEYAGSTVSIEGAAVERLLPALLPLLDGTRTVNDIQSVLGEAVAPAVEQALEGLAGAGVLTPGPTVRDGRLPARAGAAELLTDCPPLGKGPSEVADSVAGSTVVVCGSGETAEATALVLARSGVGRVAGLEPHQLGALHPNAVVVAAPHPDELDLLERLNTAALEHGFPWLQLLPFDGRASYLGPLFLPGATACHRCFRLRLASTSGCREELHALERVRAAHGVAPSLAASIAGLGATLALRWLAHREARLSGRLWALAIWPSLSVSEHMVYRVPRCPACSTAEMAAAPSPWPEHAGAR